MTRQTDLDLLDLAEAVARGDLRAAEAATRVPEASVDLRGLTSAISAVRAHAQAVKSAGAPQAATAGVGDVRMETAVSRGRIRRRPSVERGAGRIGRPTALVIAAAFLVGTAVIGLAVGGGFPVRPRPTPLPAVVVATPSPDVVTAAPTIDSSLAATPTPISPAPGRPVLFRDVQVQNVHLTPVGVGWAKDPTTIYRSIDGGVTWMDVHPPFISSVPATRFLDADTTYIATGAPAPRIAVTHDGGTTWLTADIRDPVVAVDGPIVAFRTTDVGTVSFQSLDERRLEVYRTSDGGRTWAGPIVSNVPAGMDGARSGIMAGTDVVWSSNGQADGQPFDDRLVFSIDGGVTWQDRSFPIDQRSPAGALKWVTAIRADASGHVVLVIDGGASGPCPDPCVGAQAIYVSDDFGQRWRFVKQAPNHEVALLSMSDWVLASEDPTETWWSTDGGPNWQAVVGGSRVHFDVISIASATDMWARHDCDRAAGPVYPGPDPYCDGRGAKQVLLATHDGGRTWQGVGE